ncbi:MAG TPA: sigma-70 family RNA polymerase sigma factor [Acidimicrobiales bacterium]
MNRYTSTTIEGGVAGAAAANERELLARVAKGDSAAGRELVRRYDRLIAAAARRVLFSPADVDDVVQETFLILLVSSDSIRDPARLGPWLWTTASNLARRTARRNIRSRPVEDIEARVATERDASDEVDGALERGERCVALREAMASITSEERDLIRRLTVEDRPCYATISAATSRPVGSLGPTRRRILGKLRAHPAMARVTVAA